MGEEPLPDHEIVQSGVSPEMLRRFGVVLDLAEQYHFKVIVGLITGWMSGELFVPLHWKGSTRLPILYPGCGRCVWRT